MSGVVVDTSVWIDFLAGIPALPLEEALSRGSVVLSPLVLSELVSGARHQREREAIEGLLKILPLHETPLEHWIHVGKLRRTMQNRGVSVSTPDAHVAQCALDLDAVLLSRDAVFSRIARHSALRLHSA